MLGSWWLWLAGVLFLASILTRQIPLLLLAFLFVIVGAVAHLWSRYCLVRLEYRHSLSQKRALFGQEVVFETEVTNNKILPLPWVEVVEEIPEKLGVVKGMTNNSHKPDRLELPNALSMGWYQRVKRRYPVACLHRGRFAFGPTVVRSGDLFGSSERSMELNDIQYLTVYPRVVLLESPSIPSRQIIGKVRTKRNIFPDPILTMGIREYQYGDTLKNIHWKATARTGKLQTRIFEPTTTSDYAIFLDVRTTQPPLWGMVPQLFEMSIMTAASLADHALSASVRVGLYSNQIMQAPNGPVRIPPAQHAAQWHNIMEALSQLEPIETEPIHRLILRESRNLPWASTILVVTAAPTPDLFSALLRVRRGGRSVSLVVVGEAELGGLTAGIPVYHVSDEVPWQEVETIRLENAGARSAGVEPAKVAV